MRLALRTRAMLAFGSLALLVSASVALVSYQVTRFTLVDQRQGVAERQTYVNARAVRTALLAEPEDPALALGRAQVSSGGLGLVRVGGQWFSSSVSGGRADVPAPLLEVVDDGAVGRQRTEFGDGTAVAVGVPLAGTGAAYVEIVPLAEVERTLSRTARGLLAATAAATVLGLAVGRWMSGRVLRPVRLTAEAADRIHRGDLDSRLGRDDDPDLRPLVQAFNRMVDGLQARIDRESRFASDVTHELRSPLATMSAALSVARRRVTDPTGTEALDMLEGEVARFNELIVDLLEIGRAEAGVAQLVVEDVHPRQLVESLLEGTHRDGVEVSVDWPGDLPVRLDKRRLGQALVNLLDNADNYGGGATSVTVDGHADGVLRMSVDDEGPGVPEHERQYVFQRFARGSDVDVSGTGLGLALVAEHVRLHGGTVTIGDSPAGGARFTIEIPLEPR